MVTKSSHLFVGGNFLLLGNEISRGQLNVVDAMMLSAEVVNVSPLLFGANVM